MTGANWDAEITRTSAAQPFVGFAVPYPINTHLCHTRLLFVELSRFVPMQRHDMYCIY